MIIITIIVYSGHTIVNIVNRDNNFDIIYIQLKIFMLNL